MVKSLDRLIAHLLDGIAINGGEGVSRSQLERLVQEYYQASARPSQAGLTDESASKKQVESKDSSQKVPENHTAKSGHHGNATSSGLFISDKPLVDKAFLDNVWQWLIANPEIWVRATQVSTNRASSGLQQDAQGRIDNVSSPGPSSPRAEGAEDIQGEQLGQQPIVESRLYTSQDRRWRALTGHGLDWVRVPKFEFECLAAIAMHGPKGVVQGDLVKQTGQDKRSLPTRTERLHQKGYIVKRLVFKRGSKTSMLYLKKFAPILSNTSNAHELDHIDSKLEGSAGQHESIRQLENEEAVDISNLLDSLFSILKEFNVVTFDDLKRKLGFWEKRWHMKILFKVVRRLEIMGCLRRIKAGDDNAPNHTFRCVRYLRDPEERERTLFLDSATALPDELRASMYGIVAEAYQYNEEGAALNQDEEPGIIQSFENRVPPWWSPDKPFVNVLFNIIRSAGTDGLTTTDLRRSAAGEFFARPVEILLTKHTEDWNVSQPPHLRHLSIVRDSASIGRSQHLLYLTIENFEKLVQQGLSSWDAIKKVSNEKLGQSQKNAKKMHNVYSLDRIDQYGFAEILKSVLGSKEGQGTLSQNSASTIMDFVGVTGNDPVPYLENGEWRVRYPNPHGNRKVSDGNISRTRPTKDPSIPAKPKGRPRKYAKGEELYKPEVRARLAAEGRLPLAALEFSKSRKRKGAPTTNNIKPLRHTETPLSYHIRDSRLSLLSVGAHVDPPGSAKPRAKSQGRPKKTKILVIKTARLKELVLPLLPAFVAEQTVNVSSHLRDVTSQEKESNDVEDLSMPDILPDVLPETDALAPSTKKRKTQQSSEDYEISDVVTIPQEEQPKVITENKRAKRKRNRHETDLDCNELEAEESALETRSRRRRIHHSPESNSGNSVVDLLSPLNPLTELTNELTSPLASTKSTQTNGPSTNPKSNTDSQLKVVDELSAQDQSLGNDQQISLDNTSRSPVPATATLPENAILPTIEIQSHEQHNATSVKAPAQSPRGGTIHFLRKKTMMDIVDEHGGVFPGDRDLFIVWALRWRDVNSDTAVADTRTYKMVEKALTSSGELKIFKFSFRTTKGHQITRTILARAHINPTSPLVKTLEKKMIEADCGAYIPSELGISEYQRRLVLNKQLPAVKLDEDREVKVIRHQPQATERYKEDRTLQRMGKVRDSSRNSSRSLTDEELDDEERAESRRARGEVSRYLDTGINKTRFIGSRRREWLEQLRSMHSITLADNAEDLSRGFINDSSLQRYGLGYAGTFFALMAPMQQFHAQSGTFGTFMNTLEVNRTLSSRKRTLLSEASFNVQAQSARSQEGVVQTLVGSSDPLPIGLQEILDRVLSLKSSRNHDYDSEVPHPDEFLQTVDLVEFWERKFFQPEKPDSQKFSFQFINHIPSPTQEQAALEDSKDKNFVDFAAHGPSELYTPIFVHAVAVLHKLKLKSQRAKEKKMNPTGNSRRISIETPLPLQHSERSVESSQSSPSLRDMAPQLLQDSIQVTRPSRATKVLRSGSIGPRSVETPIRAIKRSPKSKQMQPTKLFKTRKLTARDESASLMSNADAEVEAGKNTKVLYGKGVPVAQMAKTRRRRGPMQIKYMTEDTIERLLTAVVIIRTLIGGLERNIDWVIVSSLFPELSIDFVQRRWPALCKKNSTRVEQIQENFLEIFVDAYEANKIPPIDYENLINYDWAWLVKWARENLKKTSTGVLTLPPTREEINDSFTIEDEPTSSTFWRDEYFNPLATQARRMKLASEHANVAPLFSSPGSKENMESITAISWVRANIMTSLALYDAEAAKEKLLTFSESILDSALRRLINDKVVRHVNKGREVPGRLYTLTDRFLDGLKRPIGEDYFDAAMAYKARLDNDFSTKGSSEYSYYASDTDALVLINMLSTDRITLVPRNPPNNKWGLTEGGYKTRTMDKSRLNFTIDIKPNLTYIYGNPFQASSEAATVAGHPFPHPPAQPKDDEQNPIPVWYDIHGNLIQDIWIKTLAAVFYTMAMRSGVNSKEICRISKPSLNIWEVDLIMEWGLVVGVVEKVGGGFGVKEWWWCCGA